MPNLKLELTFVEGTSDGWIIATNPETEKLLKEVPGYDDGTGNFNSGIGNVNFSGLMELTIALNHLLNLSGK